MKSKKSRYLKKETLAKNILKGCLSPNDLRKLDVRIGFVYDANKELVEKHQDRMNKLDILFHEFTDNPKTFVEKYAKDGNDHHILKILKENPDLFKGLKWY